jgi:hypothetical protein
LNQIGQKLKRENQKKKQKTKKKRTAQLGWPEAAVQQQPRGKSPAALSLSLAD